MAACMTLAVLRNHPFVSKWPCADLCNADIHIMHTYVWRNRTLKLLVRQFLIWSSPRMRRSGSASARALAMAVLGMLAPAPEC